MSIFIERFFLAACVLVLGAVVFTNPMGWDKTQRVIAFFVVVLVAYFAAHTLEKNKSDKPAAGNAATETEVKDGLDTPASGPQVLASATNVNSNSGPTQAGHSTNTKSVLSPTKVAPMSKLKINGSVYQASAGLDGRIYITGSFTAVGDELHVGIARLNSDGTLDSTFAPELDGGGFAFAFFADGSLLLSGRSSGLLKLSRKGVIDRSFPVINEPRTLLSDSDGSFYTSAGKYSVTGTRLVQFTTSFETLATAKQPDGKLLLGGMGGQLIRLNADGKLDITFTSPVGIRGGNVHGLGVQKDGKVIVTGGAFALLPNVFRLNADGTIDKSFNSATESYGPVLCLPDDSILISSGNNGTSIASDSSGRIITAGAIIRLNPDGSLHQEQLTIDSNWGVLPGISVYLPLILGGGGTGSKIKSANGNPETRALTDNFMQSEIEDMGRNLTSDQLTKRLEIMRRNAIGLTLGSERDAALESTIEYALARKRPDLIIDYVNGFTLGLDKDRMYKKILDMLLELRSFELATEVINKLSLGIERDEYRKRLIAASH